MDIASLAGIGLDTLYEAFREAFSDYELQLDRSQLESMLKRRGFDPALSFAAFDRGKIAAFTLNGIGDHNGVPTAYDTGTGTLEGYRGQGLATTIFHHSIPYLKQAGIGQYLLEVLQHNTRAVSVYSNVGFAVTREFYYSGQNNGLVRNSAMLPDAYSVRPIEITDYGVSAFWDFQPSWQNSNDSVRRAAGDLIGLGAFAGATLAGYCVFEPASGDITQLAVDRVFRRKGIGSLLLQRMLELNKNDSVKAVNTEIECISLNGFLDSKNIIVKGKQFEMIRQI